VKGSAQQLHVYLTKESEQTEDLPQKRARKCFVQAMHVGGKTNAVIYKEAPYM